MQRNHVSILTVLLTAAVLVTGAAAQDRISGTSSLHSSQLVRADDLIGTEVLDPQGDKVGKVDDLLLDSQGTSVSHAVVARGGFLGLGVKRHAVPWQELQLNGATTTAGTMDLDTDRAVVINTTKDQFVHSSPPLDRDAWSEYDPDDLGRVTRRVTDILGSDIRSGTNDAIGEVEDLVIDADRGRVAYALVAYGGAWDLDADILSMPWPSLNRSGTTISASLDESSARQLAYRDEDFNRLGDEAHRSQLYGATSSRGYWNDGTGDDLARSDASWKRDEAADYDRVGGTGSQSGAAGRRTDDHAAAAGDSLKQGSKPGATAGMKGEQVTISGIIESVTNPSHTGTSSSGATGATPEYGDGLTLRLKPDNGAAVTVDAGSKAALDRQNLTLSKGDRITVTGHKMAAGGTSAAGDIIMATTIQKGSQTVRIERGAMDHKHHHTPDKAKPKTDTPSSHG